MEIESNSYLPLNVSLKYYNKWDCEVNSIVKNGTYVKCLDGKGEIQFVNGNSFKGNFKNGLMTGQGVYKWKSGLVYQGTFTQNKLTGSGRLLWPDGSYYQGAVKQGKRHGHGQFVSKKDNSSYKGQWRQGLKHGNGILFYGNGSIYEGKFINGLRQGFGKMKYHTGNQYNGQWKQDKKQGKGVMNWVSNGQRYQGEWKQDLPNGKGNYIWFQGKGQTKNIKTLFKGQWKQGKREGLGLFIYGNGCKMEGNFQFNLKNGLFLLMDEYGNNRLEHFTNDKPLSRLQKLKQEDICNNKGGVIKGIEIAENPYRQYVDFQNALIDDSVYNLLLRQNSHLRQIHKYLVMGGTRETFGGLNLEGIWRMIRDLKIPSRYHSLASIDRQFSEGYKSCFNIEHPVKSRLQLSSQHIDLLKNTEQFQFQFKIFCKLVLNQQLNWKQFSTNQHHFNKIVSKQYLNPHDPNKVIIYRHFIVFILRISLSLFKYQTQEKSFRKYFQQMIQNIKKLYSNQTSFPTQKICSQNITVNSSKATYQSSSNPFSQEINHQLFRQIASARSSPLGRKDETVSIRQIYCLLDYAGLLKDSTQRILLLQKMQRGMRDCSGLLKKQNKANYGAIQKICLNSPHFVHLMHYELTFYQFNELLNSFLARKIGSHSKQDFNKKYSEHVNSLRNAVINNRIPAKTIKLQFQRRSYKDRTRDELIARHLQQLRIQQLQRKKKIQQDRQQRQRELMTVEDKDAQEDNLSQENDDYLD